jgi:hypothetical protein
MTRSHRIVRRALRVGRLYTEYAIVPRVECIVIVGVLLWAEVMCRKGKVEMSS